MSRLDPRAGTREDEGGKAGKVERPRVVWKFKAWASRARTWWSYRRCPRLKGRGRGKSRGVGRGPVPCTEVPKIIFESLKKREMSRRQSDALIAAEMVVW